MAKAKLVITRTVSKTRTRSTTKNNSSTSKGPARCPYCGKWLKDGEVCHCMTNEIEAKMLYYDLTHVHKVVRGDSDAIKERIKQANDILKHKDSNQGRSSSEASSIYSS
jgi:hypothetical protein